MDPNDAPLPSRPIDVTRAEILAGLLGRFTPGRAIDLACGTGWFSQIAASSGWKVTALDARRRPWPDMDGIEWLEQDVRDADTAGYDLILCLGIFYHLTYADQQVLLGKCAGTPMILDTHVALLSDAEAAPGYWGWWYPEPPGTLSSWENEKSFWPTQDTLRKMLAEHGYTQVEATEPWYHGADRTFWVCQP